MYAGGRVMHGGAMLETDDETLLARIRGGDRQAFRALTQRYLDKIWRLSFRMLNNRHDAEDVTQEVFLAVWNHRHGWKPGEAKFSTWLYRVAVNRSIDLARKRKCGHGLLDDTLPDRETPSGEDHAGAQQTQQLLLACMKQLPEAQMLALIYFYYEELDIREICTRLNATEDAIRSLLKRGRAKMKEIIRDTLGDDSRTVEGAAPDLWRQR